MITELAAHGLSEEQSLRLQDYLDDKLQNSNDLESLNTLLENVTNQQTLLRQQVGLPLHLEFMSISSVVSFKRRKRLFLKQRRPPILIPQIYFNEQRRSGNSRPISTGVY